VVLPDLVPRPDQNKPVRIRLLSPLGLYTRDSFSIPGARLLSRDDLVVSAVEIAPEITHGLGSEHSSELEILALEEIRFLTALELSVHPNDGLMFVYPLHSHFDVVLGLDDDVVLDLAREHAQRVAGDRWLRRGVELPAAAGGPPYEWREEGINLTLVAELVSKASLTDHLLMRGLGTLLKASMAWQHWPIAETALAMLFIALEASLEIILRTLRAQGMSEPKARDAGLYLDEVFNPGIDTDGYFKEFYDIRNKFTHPSSRQFGVFAIAPLAADDFYFLRDGLVEVFGFLITGRVLPP
jgi:hypothetical protein